MRAIYATRSVPVSDCALRITSDRERDPTTASQVRARTRQFANQSRGRKFFHFWRLLLRAKCGARQNHDQKGGGGGGSHHATPTRLRRRIASNWADRELSALATRDPCAKLPSAPLWHVSSLCANLVNNVVSWNHWFITSVTILWDILMIVFNYCRMGLFIWMSHFDTIINKSTNRRTFLRYL